MKMDNRAYEYFLDWFEEAEWFESTSEMTEHVLPLVLKPVIFKQTRYKAFGLIGMFALGAICLYFIFCLSENNTNHSSRRRHKKATVSEIKLNGINYPIECFEEVNQFMEQGEKGKATQELMRITDLTAEAAVEVINRWNYYWR